MTPRYDLLINAIHETNTMILMLFGFALFLVLTDAALAWLPERIRPITRRIYLASVIGLFSTVLFAAW